MRHRTAVVGLIAASLVVAGPPAVAGPEETFVSKIDAERRARGLRSLTVAADLVALARRHSERMAERGEVFHDPAIGSSVSGWKRIGENAGSGPSVSSLHTRFMGSSYHRGNILDPSFNQIGVGVVRRDDVLWVTQIFVQRATRTSAPRVSRSPVRRMPAVHVVRRARPRPPQAPTPRTVAILIRLMQDDLVLRNDAAMLRRVPAGS